MVSYFKKRQHSIYLSYVDFMVCALGAHAQSLIDVGSHNCSYLSWWPWIPDKASLDIDKPYQGDGVRSIRADFLEWTPDRRYEIATCLQVLEHIEDADRFAQKLLQLADHVIVSVPYKWEKGSNKAHVQDPVDKNKFDGWFGRGPNYRVVATEPFLQKKSRRLIAYFNTSDPTSTAFRAARRLASERMMSRASRDITGR